MAHSRAQKSAAGSNSVTSKAAVGTLMAVLVVSAVVILAQMPAGFIITGFVAFAMAFTVVLALTEILPRVLYAMTNQPRPKVVRKPPITALFSNIFPQSNDAISLSAETLPVPLMTIGFDGQVRVSNAAARNLLAFKKRDRVRLPELVEGLGQSVTDWLKREIQRGGQHQAQMLRAKRAGDTYLTVTIAPGPNGIEEDAVTIILTDATEMKSLKAQFVQSQKMQAIGQLAGGVAHDFNNLLTAISGYCDLLMLRHEKTDPDYADLKQISQNANRAASLVGQLLAFSRKQTLKPSRVNVDDTLSDLTHLLSRLVGEKVNIRFDRSKNLPAAFVDGRQLEQVIMNLVVNSRDAMPNGGNIWIRTKEMEFKDVQFIQKARVLPGRYIGIEVQDDGSGIAPEVMPQIFDPFFSTKKMAEGQSGTGLGLSTVYGIIKQTGGYVFADSEKGKGTMFQILLPIATKPVAVEPVEPEAVNGHTANMSKSLVLLVEDEDPVRTFAARALRMQGVTLLEAASGEQALKIVRKYRDQIDVIVSDVIMPGLDGPSWVAQTKEDCPDAKVIFISGYAEDAFKKTTGDLDGARFLPKPFSLQELTEAVGQAVDQKLSA